MKKFLLLFTLILSFSLLPVTNKTYAQEEKYPNYIMKTSYNYHVLDHENFNTYEFRVYYYVYDVQLQQITTDEYFLINDIGINFRKGINRNTNSYVLEELSVPPMANYSIIGLRVTVLRTLLNDNYNYPDDTNGIQLLFRDDTALYILYQSNKGSLDYNSGYDDGYNKGRDDGYNQGYDEGYDIGYDVGYDYGYDLGYDFGYDDGYTVGVKEPSPEAYEKGRQDGYNEASKEFKENFGLKVDVWLVPAIIIVFAVGIFVTYRRGRDV